MEAGPEDSKLDNWNRRACRGGAEGVKMELKGGKLETKEQEEVFQNLSLC